MKHEVKLPELGDDANDTATVSVWLVEKDDMVSEGDELLELTTDKAAFSVPSPYSGQLAERLVEEGDEVTVGDVLCVVES